MYSTKGFPYRRGRGGGARGEERGRMARRHHRGGGVRVAPGRAGVQVVVVVAGGGV